MGCRGSRSDASRFVDQRSSSVMRHILNSFAALFCLFGLKMHTSVDLVLIINPLFRIIPHQIQAQHNQTNDSYMPVQDTSLLSLRA
jgi:hypothetical protein